MDAIIKEINAINEKISVLQLQKKELLDRLQELLTEPDFSSKTSIPECGILDP